MTHSVLTNQIRESMQRSSRNGATIDTFIIHHQAGTNDNATIDLMVSGRKLVSANYTISNEGRITLVVNEDFRAWTSGSSRDGGRGASWDRRAITVEIENESGAPDWRVSEAAVQATAMLYNDVRSRYPITNVFGHRELWEKFRASYPTYCPGPELKNRVLAAAGYGGLAPAIVLPPIPVAVPVAIPVPPRESWEFWLPDNNMQIAVQVALWKRRPPRYRGLRNGDWGKLSIMGIQKTCALVGYSGLIDGIEGPMTCHYVQVYAQKFGDYLGPIDKLLGNYSWAGFLLGLQRP
jgi:hypothetical protein